jgi:cytochrome P450
MAGGLGVEFRPWDSPQLEDPYPFFARARAEEPVFFSADLAGLIEERRRDPGDDVITHMIETRYRSERPLDTAELVNNL